MGLDRNHLTGQVLRRGIRRRRLGAPGELLPQQHGRVGPADAGKRIIVEPE
jgi:hypothetical protein